MTTIPATPAAAVEPDQPAGHAAAAPLPPNRSCSMLPLLQVRVRVRSGVGLD